MISPQVDDYRITENLKIIDCINDILARVDAKIGATVDDDPDAQLLTTIPGVGKYTALVISSAIDGAGRFVDSHSLVAYFGLAPTVRNSADKVHHGRMTKKGNKLVRHVLWRQPTTTRGSRHTPSSRSSTGASKPRGAPPRPQSRQLQRWHASCTKCSRTGGSSKHGYNSLIFHSGQVFKQRFLYEGSGASGC